GLEADFLHRLVERAKVATDPVVAAIGVRLGRELRRHDAFEVRIQDGDDALEVAAVEGLERFSQDLDVPLGHTSQVSPTGRVYAGASARHGAYALAQCL